MLICVIRGCFLAAMAAARAQWLQKRLTQKPKLFTVPLYRSWQALLPAQVPQTSIASRHTHGPGLREEPVWWHRFLSPVF